LVGSVKPLVANLDEAVTNVSTTVDAVREPLTRDLAELQRTLENARTLIDSVRGVVGDNDDDIHQTVQSLRTASENVRLLSETLKERPWNLIRTTQPPDRKVPR
jgi:ABC-type transporter Mla subunit MlaD